MKFFIDNTLAPKLAQGLHGLVSPEHQVVHLRDKFGSSVPDADWMQALAHEGGWVVLTADPRVHKNPHEKAAWKESGHVVFFLKQEWLKLRSWDQAQALVQCFPKIIAKATSAKPGATFFVSANGRIAG